MKKKFYLILISLLIFQSIFITCYGKELPSGPEVTSEGCLLMDLDSGQVLFSKNAHDRFYPASTTKILTALIVLEKCDLSEIVTVGEDPPYIDGTKIYLFEDEQLTVEQMLYAMMLESANDCAEALAEHVSGSVEAFAVLMNQKAKELGCTDSNFVNPHGLHDDNHYTSAWDLALIAREAMKNPVFRKIVSTRSSQIPPTNKQPELRYLNNLNKLMFYGKYYYEGVDGIKTGYTSQAKNTLVASCMKDGLHLMGVFLSCSSGVYTDAKNLFDYGFDNYSSKTLLDSEQTVYTVFFDDRDESVDLYPAENLNVAVPSGTNPEVSEKVTLTSDFSHLKAGDEAGYVEVRVDDDDTYKVALITHTDYGNTTYSVFQFNNKKIGYLMYLKWIIPSGILIFIALITAKKHAKRHKRCRLP